MIYARSQQPDMNPALALMNKQIMIELSRQELTTLSALMVVNEHTELPHNDIDLMTYYQDFMRLAEKFRNKLLKQKANYTMKLDLHEAKALYRKAEYIYLNLPDVAIYEQNVMIKIIERINQQL